MGRDASLGRRWESSDPEVARRPTGTGTADQEHHYTTMAITAVVVIWSPIEPLRAGEPVDRRTRDHPTGESGLTETQSSGSSGFDKVHEKRMTGEALKEFAMERGRIQCHTAMENHPPLLDTGTQNQMDTCERTRWQS